MGDRFLRLITLLIVSVTIITGCSSGPDGDTALDGNQNSPVQLPEESATIPTDYEEQPEYTGQSVFINQDTDGDTVPDIIDLYPSDKNRTMPDIFNEEEFNNNLEEANTLPEDTELPVVISGTLSPSENVYVDSDMFTIPLKKGERVSILVFSGTLTDLKSFQIDLQKIEPPYGVYLITSDGKKLPSTRISGPYFKGIGTEIPEDGKYTVEVSITNPASQNYSYPYVILLQRDSDFDGVGNDLESILGSNSGNSDTDGDFIDDFNEIFSFLRSIRKFTEIKENRWWDTDKDGIPNWYDVDSDGDGPPDRIETAMDTDMDGIPNFIDSDSNGNNIPDTEESGISFQQPSDTDGDRQPDFADIDIDNDGLPNNIDPEPEKVNQPDYLFSEGSIFLSSITSLLDGEEIPDAAVKGYKLKIYGINIPQDTLVILQTESGSVSVNPETIDTENGTVILTVPASAVSGPVYIYSPSGKKLSSPFELTVLDPEEDPVLISTSLNAYPGETVTLEGINLSRGNVSVVLTGKNSKITITGISDGNSVGFTVPQNAETGFLHIETGGKKSNRIRISVVRNVNVTLVLPDQFPVTYQHIKIYSKGNEYTFGPDLKTSIPVRNLDAGFITSALEGDFNNDGVSEIYTFFEAVVIPGQTEVVLDAKSTAVKWIFSTIGFHLTQPQDKWEEIIALIESQPETQELADYISQLIKNDLSAITEFSDPELITKYKNSIRATVEAFSQWKTLNSTSIKPEIKPSETQYDISVTPENRSVNLENDTKLFLSVLATGSDGTILHRHITNPWDPAIIGPQGWGLLFIATKKKINLRGMDTDIQIATAGLGEPKVINNPYRYVVFRTVFDGIVYPPIEDIFSSILSGVMGKDAAAILLEIQKGKFDDFASFIGTVIAEPSPESIRNGAIKYMISPLKTAIQGCMQISPSPYCRALAKAIGSRIGKSADEILLKLTGNIGKEILIKLTPIVGQIDAALDIMSKINTYSGVFVTIHDMTNIPGNVEFQARFPFSVDEVLPTCVSETSGYFHLIIRGSGFYPVNDYGYTDYPDVYLSGFYGKIVHINEDGSEMTVRFNRDLFEDGEHNLVVKHHQLERVYETPVRIYGKEKIQLDKLEPDRGLPGDTVRIYGCGFYPGEAENEVLFTGTENTPVKATVVGVKPGYLEVIVPTDAVTGDVFVTVKGAESNRLTFTVDKAKAIINFGDCGFANDDTFALYIDSELIHTMPAPSRPFDVPVNLSKGRHTVTLVGITAPDDIGTYCISFSSNITIISGPPTEGSDLTAGVSKSWIIEVTDSISPQSTGQRSQSTPVLPE
ncbi:hypothetical protein [Persephonella sp.]